MCRSCAAPLPTTASRCAACGAPTGAVHLELARTRWPLLGLVLLVSALLVLVLPIVVAGS